MIVLSLFFLGGNQPILRAEEPSERPVDAYVIGPEDILSIYVHKEEFLSKTVPVRIDGKISLPLIGEIQAAELTPPQLQDVLAQRLKEFINDPVVTVIVQEPNSFKVYISGGVKNSGIHRLRSQTTLLQIISMAGGFTEWANPKKILVIRNEKGKETRTTVNYKDMVSGKTPTFVLKAGDTIIVP
jgi:polysaccharide biosynthesis/export protein